MATACRDPAFGKCRCCLKAGFHNDILEQYNKNGVSKEYREVFFECYKFHLSTNEKLTKLICTMCIKKLTDALDFKVMVTESEQQLLREIDSIGTEALSNQTTLHSELFMKQEQEEEIQMEDEDFCMKDLDHGASVYEPPETAAVKEDTSEAINPDAPQVEDQPELHQTEQTADITNSTWDSDAEALDTIKEEKEDFHLEEESDQHQTEMDADNSTSDLITEPSESLETIKEEKEENSHLEEESDQHQTEKDADNASSTSGLNTGSPLIDKLKMKTNEVSESPKMGHHNFAETRPIKKIKHEISKNIIQNRICQTQETNQSNRDISLKRNYTSESDKGKNNNKSGVISPKKLSCPTCRYTTKTENILKLHLQAHSAARNFICDTCSYIGMNKKSLIRHIRTHTGEKPYACKICYKKFSRSSALNSHIRTHSSEKPYLCEICEKRFTRSSNLRRHIGTHTGEKPYICEICDKKFRQSHDLSKHIITHTGEKPYLCEICDKKFTRSSDLRRHTGTHPGEKPYICEICDKKFARSSHLSSHKGTHTGQNHHHA